MYQIIGGEQQVISNERQVINNEHQVIGSELQITGGDQLTCNLCVLLITTEQNEINIHTHHYILFFIVGFY